MGDFVSRAGEKLEFALDAFEIDVNGMVCADLGSSTGGFTDCLLQRGAKKVYSVDTAVGELDWKLKQDKKVVVMEGTNAVHVSLPEKVDFVSIDVGWTRQDLVLPRACKLIKENSSIVSLYKPGYEQRSGEMDHEGLEPSKVAERISKSVGSEIKILKVVESPIRGKRKGGKEFLIHAKCN